MKTFNEYVIEKAQLMNAIAAQHEALGGSDKELYNDYCAASSGFNIIFELSNAADYNKHCAKSGLLGLTGGLELKDKLDVTIAEQILKASPRFYTSRPRVLTENGIRAIQEKLVEAVKVARSNWFAKQLELVA